MLESELLPGGHKSLIGSDVVTNDRLALVNRQCAGTGLVHHCNALKRRSIVGRKRRKNRMLEYAQSSIEYRHSRDSAGHARLEGETKLPNDLPWRNTLGDFAQDLEAD